MNTYNIKCVYEIATEESPIATHLLYKYYHSEYDALVNEFDIDIRDELACLALPSYGSSHKISIENIDYTIVDDFERIFLLVDINVEASETFTEEKLEFAVSCCEIEHGFNVSGSDLDIDGYRVKDGEVMLETQSRDVKIRKMAEQ